MKKSSPQLVMGTRAFLLSESEHFHPLKMSTSILESDTLADIRPSATVTADDGEFVDFGWRPCFKEHDRDGVEFDEAAMQDICDECNKRIIDTGDFATVAIRHTEEDGSNDPEVIGLFGPYRVGKVGRLKPKWGIYGRMRVYKEDAHKVKKYPRLSVEYWANEDSPTKGYFDPVCLLGAETPELDLGIRYSKGRKGRRRFCYSRVMRFAATTPGGSNTYVSGCVGDDEKDNNQSSATKTTYEKDPSVSISSGDIQQVVQALIPVMKEHIEQTIAARLPPTDEQPTDAVVPIDGLESLDETNEGIEDTDGDSIADMVDQDDDGDGIPDDLDADEDDEDDADEDDEDDETSDDENMDDDGDDDDSPMLNEADGDRVSVDGDGTLDQKSSYQAGAPDMADGTTKKQDDEKSEAIKYKKERDDLHARYQKEVKDHGELKIKYKKAMAELTTANATLAESRASERKAIRYQKLEGLASEGFVLEVEEELADCESMDDAAFDKHCERIQTKYQRVPRNMIPVVKTEFRDGKKTPSKSERCAKRADEIATKYRKEGKPIDFRRAYEMAEEEFDANNESSKAVA